MTEKDIIVEMATWRLQELSVTTVCFDVYEGRKKQKAGRERLGCNGLVPTLTRFSLKIVETWKSKLALFDNLVLHHMMHRTTEGHLCKDESTDIQSCTTHLAEGSS